MAEEETATEKSEEKEEKTSEKSEAKDSKDSKSSSSFSLMTILMIVGAVLISSVLGAGLSFVLTNKKPATASAETEEQALEEKPVKEEKAKDKDAANAQGTWFYDMEPIVANLDVPGVTRYVRVALTLEITFDPEKEEGLEFQRDSLPVLTNWLTIYLSSLSIDDIRGAKNLKRMQMQILDSFNETLYANQKPKIKQILFKEIAIQ